MLLAWVGWGRVWGKVGGGEVKWWGGVGWGESMVEYAL